MNHHHIDRRRQINGHQPTNAGPPGRPPNQGTAGIRARSAECSTAGRSPTEPEVIERLAVEVYRQGRGIYFSPDDLKRMPWPTRDLIESEARRICNRARP